MIKNDRQLGAPFGLFSDTKANIEALTGLTGGETAYATDTGEDGVYDAVGSAWVWGRSGGGGGGTPAGNDREIQFNDDGSFGASEDFKFTDDGTVVIGTPSPHITIPPLAIAQGRSGGSSFHYQFTFGDETLYSRLIGYHARGTLGTSAATELNDILMAIVGRGYWAQDSPNPNGAELRIVATENHEDGKHGTAFELWVIPNESTTRVKVATIDEDGINLESGKTIRVNGEVGKSSQVLITHGQLTNVPAASTRYMIPGMMQVQVSTYSIPMPAGTFRNLFVRQVGNQPAGGTMTFKLFAGPVGSLSDTGVGVTFAAGSSAQDRTDTTNTYNHTAGQHIQFVLQNNAPSDASAIIGGVTIGFEQDVEY